tara:strand:- start:16 stop:591 length:576 start_codon:yes stop_codon:yes gene_type:complete
MQKIDVPNSLIGMSHIDETICDDLIDFYKKDKMFPAWEGVSAGQKIQKDIKESFDKSLVISLQHPAIIKYIECLQNCINGYAELYPTLNAIKFRLANIFNIQKYPKGGGYKIWHCERMNSFAQTNNRVLAFMTYLNTVEDGGETQFALQEATIKAKKGRTLIWPSEWSHLHRGVPSPTKEKYIATGWFELA